MSTLRSWLFSLIAFLAVWQSVQALVPFSDAMGPGTRGAMVTATRGSQLENLTQRVQVELRGLPARTSRVLTTGVAGLLGGRRLADAPDGRDGLGYLLGIVTVCALARVSVLTYRRMPAPNAAFAWYLLGVGIVAGVAYAATRPSDELVRRYILLALLIPVGLTGLWLTLEPLRLVRQAVVVFAVGWAALAGVDNWRLFDRYMSGQVADTMGEIVSVLDARGVTIVEAPYWRAYKLAFLSQERIVAASTDVVRITEYETRAVAAGPNLFRVQEEPCDAGTRVGDWFLCPRRPRR